MTQEQFNQLVEGNVESPVGQYLIVAKQKVSDKTKAGVIISEGMKEELEKKQDFLTIVATAEDSKFKVGQVVRSVRVLTQTTPFNTAVDDYELAVIMAHDIITVQPGFSK